MSFKSSLLLSFVYPLYECATDVEFGATFGIAVCGAVFALVETTLLCAFIRQSGDGPLYGCVTECTMTSGQGNCPQEQASQSASGPIVSGTCNTEAVATIVATETEMVSQTRPALQPHSPSYL